MSNIKWDNVAVALERLAGTIDGKTVLEYLATIHIDSQLPIKDPNEMFYKLGQSNLVKSLIFINGKNILNNRG